MQPVPPLPQQHTDHPLPSQPCCHVSHSTARLGLGAWRKGKPTWQMGLGARVSVHLMKSVQAPGTGMAIQHLGDSELCWLG